MTLWEITWTFTDDDGDTVARSTVVNAYDPRLWAETSREMVPAELRDWAESVGAMNYAPRLVSILYATHSPVMVTTAGVSSAESLTIHDTADPQTFREVDR